MRSTPILDRVTITGADQSVDPLALLYLSKQYPFVEWGILASANHNGGPRFPPLHWIGSLQGLQPGSMNLSLHLCGRWVRRLLLGVNELPEGLVDGFQRIQLNFHAERSPCAPEAFARVVREFKRPVIFQLDDAGSNAHLEAAMEHDAGDCLGLFDVSGGRGVLPEEWPQPVFTLAHAVFGGMHEQWAYHGYAGGLGPENLATEIPRILQAAEGTRTTAAGRVWIDMETRVRSSGDAMFDLDKVAAALEAAKPFVTLPKR